MRFPFFLFTYFPETGFIFPGVRQTQAWRLITTLPLWFFVLDFIFFIFLLFARKFIAVID